MTTNDAPFWDLTVQGWPQFAFGFYMILAIVGFGWMLAAAISAHRDRSYREATSLARWALVALVWPVAGVVYVVVWFFVTLTGTQDVYFTKNKTETKETR